MVAGLLHTEISVRHRELNPDTVAHLSTNRARRRLTSLIEANAPKPITARLSVFDLVWGLFTADNNLSR